MFYGNDGSKEGGHHYILFKAPNFGTDSYLVVKVFVTKNTSIKCFIKTNYIHCNIKNIQKISFVLKTFI